MSPPGPGRRPCPRALTGASHCLNSRLKSQTLPLTTLHNTPADPNLLLPPLPLLTIYIVYRQEALCIIQLLRLIPGRSNEKEFHCYTIKEPVLLYSSISNRKGRICEAVPPLLPGSLHFTVFNTGFWCNGSFQPRNLNHLYIKWAFSFKAFDIDVFQNFSSNLPTFCVFSAYERKAWLSHKIN